MHIRLYILLCVALLAAACSTVPITGRSQLNLIPGQSMLSMSFSQYDQFLKENKVSTNKEQTAMVKRVGADDFLAKFQPDDLATRVAERIKRADRN